MPLDSTNSFITVAEARTFASSRGVSLSSDDSVVEAQAIKAMDYILSQEHTFDGVRINDNAIFPRTFNMDISLEYAGNAQAALIIEQHKGTDILPTSEGPAIKKEKVDVIETEYAENSDPTPSPKMRSVDIWLDPLRKSHIYVRRA